MSGPFMLLPVEPELLEDLRREGVMEDIESDDDLVDDDDVLNEVDLGALDLKDVVDVDIKEPVRGRRVA